MASVFLERCILITSCKPARDIWPDWFISDNVLFIQKHACKRYSLTVQGSDNETTKMMIVFVEYPLYTKYMQVKNMLSKTKPTNKHDLLKEMQFRILLRTTQHYSKILQTATRHHFIAYMIKEAFICKWIATNFKALTGFFRKTNLILVDTYPFPMFCIASLKKGGMKTNAVITFDVIKDNLVD